jgi:peptidoglycan/xylan/chitin deacetylase (PgdA/CDA1 family)
VYPWNLVIPAAGATGVCAWGALHPRSQLFGPVICSAGNACALTFDDGPNPAVTPRLLSLLERYGIRATFFVLGKYVDENPGLAKEISGRNHVIGNHTYGHPNMLFFTAQRIVDELTRCEDSIFKATGRHGACVRPPFGFRGPQFYWAARRTGLSTVVMWSVSARDWTPQPWERVSRRLRRTRRGDILLFHDGHHRASNADRSHTLNALEYWLPRWKDSGLEFTATWTDSDVLE